MSVVRPYPVVRLCTDLPYILALRELAAQCEFGDLEERQISVQISNGVLDQHLREKLWEDDLTLTDVVKRCAGHEQSKLNKKLCNTEVAVNAQYYKQGQGGRGRGRGLPRASSQDAAGRGRGYRASSQEAAGRGRRYNRGFHGHGYRGRGSARGRPPTPSRGAHTWMSPPAQNFQPGAHAVAPGAHHRDQRQYQSNMYKCARCSEVHAPKQCPAYGKHCHFCSLKGHFQKCCRKKHVYVTNIETDYYDCDDMYESYGDQTYEYEIQHVSTHTASCTTCDANTGNDICDTITNEVCTENNVT